MSEDNKKKYLRIPHLSIIDSCREFGKNPFVDWIFILSISAIIMIFLILTGFNLYARVNDGSIKGSSDQNFTVKKSFNPEDLSSMVKYFKDREIRSEGIKREGI